MSDDDEHFQQIWGFRRNDCDLDSSSDDHSGPSPLVEPTQQKHKLSTDPPVEEDDQQAIHSPTARQGGQEKVGNEEPNKAPKRSWKKQVSNAEASKSKSNDPEPSDAALTDLQGFMKSLVEGIKVAREDLLKWMKNEMEISFKDDMTSKPTGTSKGQRRGSKEIQNNERSKTPRSNPIKARKREGTTSQNRKVGSSGKSAKDSKISHERSGVVVPEKEPAENNVFVATPADQEQKLKGKRLRPSSAKKQKVAVSNQQPDKESARTSASVNASASAPDHVTLPTVLPRQEAESSERTNSEGVDDRAISRQNAMNQASNLLSSQLITTPTSYQNNRVFAQNGLTSDYERNTFQATGNIQGAGNGNRFSFARPSQGLTGGYGVANIPSQFGLQYFSQESMLSGLRVNGGHPIMPSGSHAFVESYGSYNQQLRFRAQGGVMPLQSPDNIRAGNLQPKF